MHQSIGFYPAALLIASLTPGCDEPNRAGAAASGSASTSATTLASPPSGAPPIESATARPAFDPTDFCARLCDKSAECGLTKAERLARTSGDRREKDVVKSARSALPDVKSTCRAACQKEPPASATDARATAAEACMSKDDCEAFSACLDAI